MFGKLKPLQISRTALLLAVALAAGPALAQSNGTPSGASATPAVVTAVSYGQIPAGASFETQANDTSELNQEVLDRLGKQLADRGYTVDDKSALVMQVETDLVRGQAQDTPLGQASVNNTNNADSNLVLNGRDPNTRVDATVQARLFSTTQNSLLNPNQTIPSGEKVFRISLAVYNRANGLYVWRGSATRDNPDTDITRASDQMIAILVANIGKTLKAPAK
jgi:hypothetical protein